MFNLRKMLILGIIVFFLAAFAFILYLSDLMLRVSENLNNSSLLFQIIFYFIVGTFLLTALGVIWKVGTIYRRAPQKKSEQEVAPPRVSTVAELQKKADTAREMGVDVVAIEKELEKIEVEPQELDVAFFGKISTGKSSLIQTLLPNARIETSIIGGSTSVIESYYFENKHGLTLKLLDMPGTEQAGTLEGVDNEVMNAARRVHIVVYVVDQDLTATDKKAIEKLHHFDKPMIVALNKINHYSESERAELRERITSRLPADVRLVEVASAYVQSVRRVDAQGAVTWEQRLTAGQIQPLLDALAELSGARGILAQKNRQAMLHLADEKLSRSVVEYRRKNGELLVKSYSRKAMVGGVAAVGPGSDLVIQGYLAIDMMKKITKLYGISAKEIDLQGVVDAASGRLKSQRTIVLMLGGNICKAFPGIGTVVGGASHAVAYGLIFESLGLATLQALEESDKQGFSAQAIVQDFEKQLNTNLEQRAKKLLKIALGGKKHEQSE